MNPDKHPGLRDVDDSWLPKVLYHYTDEASLKAIIASGVLKASTLEGNQHTHYGKGVYLTDIGPAGLDGYGHVEAMQRIYNDVSAHAVEKMQFYLEIAVDASWGHLLSLARSSPEKTNYGRWLNIFIVPGSADLKIAGHVRGHGQTSIKTACDHMTTSNGKTAAQNYAYRLVQEQKEFTAEEKRQSERYGNQPPRGDDYVFIGGHTVKRPDGWDGDWRFPKTYD